MDPKKIQAVYDKIMKNIERDGVNITIVFPTEKEGITFAYTTGLWMRHKHPEIVVIGLSSNTAGAVLNNVSFLVDKGTVFEAGKSYDSIAKGYLSHFIKAEKYNELAPLSISNQLYHDESYEALQLVWPDKNHRFPWDKGCDPYVINAQPLLQIKNNG